MGINNRRQTVRIISSINTLQNRENLLVVGLDRGVKGGDLGIPYLALFVGLGLAKLSLFVVVGLAESFIC